VGGGMRCIITVRIASSCDLVRTCPHWRQTIDESPTTLHSAMGCVWPLHSRSRATPGSGSAVGAGGLRSGR
jgi:hypothetical protein